MTTTVLDRSLIERLVREALRTPATNGHAAAKAKLVVNVSARHCHVTQSDLERLFGLLQTGSIWPHVAERISFDEVAEAHRRLEAGGLEGKLVLCPELPSRRDRVLP